MERAGRQRRHREFLRGGGSLKKKKNTPEVARCVEIGEERKKQK